MEGSVGVVCGPVHRQSTDLWSEVGIRGPGVSVLGYPGETTCRRNDRLPYKLANYVGFVLYFQASRPKLSLIILHA